ncbi:MAG: hypothetical protein AB1665_07470 [Candidatus Thermoplasmatota archaeon]
MEKRTIFSAKVLSLLGVVAILLILLIGFLLSPDVLPGWSRCYTFGDRGMLNYPITLVSTSNDHVYAVWDSDIGFYYAKIENGSVVKRALIRDADGSRIDNFHERYGAVVNLNNSLVVISPTSTESISFTESPLMLYTQIDEDGNQTKKVFYADTPFISSSLAGVAVDENNMVHICHILRPDYSSPLELSYMVVDGDTLALIRRSTISLNGFELQTPKLLILNEIPCLFIISGEKVRYLPLNQNSTPEMIILNQSLSYYYYHDICMGPEDDFYVLGILDDGSSQLTLTKVSINGSILWTQRIGNPIDSSRGALAVDNQGQVHIVWEDSPIIRYSCVNGTSGKILIDGINLTPKSRWGFFSLSPSLVVDTKGYVHVGWVEVTVGCFHQDQGYVHYRTTAQPNDYSDLMFSHYFGLGSIVLAEVIILTVLHIYRKRKLNRPFT